MKCLVLVVVFVAVVHQTRAFWRTHHRNTGTDAGTSGGSSSHRTKPQLPIAKPRLPTAGGTSGGSRVKPVLPRIGGTRQGHHSGSTKTSSKLIGGDVKTRIPADKPKVPTRTSPKKPHFPGTEKPKLDKALDVFKQYGGTVGEAVVGSMVENAAEMAFNAILGSWMSNNKEGEAQEQTPSGDAKPAEITNQCSDEEGKEKVKEAIEKLKNGGITDIDSPESKQYIQDYVAYVCAVNTA